MKRSTILILAVGALVPMFPVGLDSKKTSLIGWLWSHTIFGPDFDMVPEEDYLNAFQRHY